MSLLLLLSLHDLNLAGEASHQTGGLRAKASPHAGAKVTPEEEESFVPRPATDLDGGESVLECQALAACSGLPSEAKNLYT